MARSFDPDTIRKNPYSRIAQARELVDKPFNAFFWAGAIGEVAEAHFVGGQNDPEWHTAELLQLARNVLRKELAVPPADAKKDRLYNVAKAYQALALGDWIATGVPQPETFATGHDIAVRYFAMEYKRKKPKMEHGYLPVLRAALAAERLDQAEAFIDEHLSDKRLDARKARNAAELCLAIRTEAKPHAGFGERYLRARLGRALGGGSYGEGALLYYLASLAGVPGHPSELLTTVRTYISYLRPKKKPKVTRFSQIRNDTNAPDRTGARPPRILASSLPLVDPTTKEKSRAVWKETADGWAVQVRGSLTGDLKALFEERAPHLVEWSHPRSATLYEESELATRLPRLRRATLDADSLARWSRSKEPLPLEVAFAPSVDHAWHDARRVRTPAKLSRKIWNDPLKVGALTSLRALSVDGRESDRDRIKRGDAPYLIVPPWFVSSPLAGQLEALEVNASLHDIALSLELFDALPNLQELILWFRGHRVDTACFWIHRDKTMLIQSFESLATQGWGAILDAVLPKKTGEMFRRVDVATVRAANVDAIQAKLGKYVSLGEIRTSVPLREL